MLNEYQKLNTRKLTYCEYLNLQGSEFNALDAKFLFSLQYINIAFSKITEVDFRKCSLLEKIVADDS